MTKLPCRWPIPGTTAAGTARPLGSMLVAALLIVLLATPAVANGSSRPPYTRLAEHHDKSPSAIRVEDCGGVDACDSRCTLDLVLGTCRVFNGDLTMSLADAAASSPHGEVRFRKLEVVTGNVDFTQGGQLAGVRKLKMSRLKSVGGHFQLSASADDAPELTTLVADSLKSVDCIIAQYAPALKEISLASLDASPAPDDSNVLDLSDNPSLVVIRTARGRNINLQHSSKFHRPTTGSCDFQACDPADCTTQEIVNDCKALIGSLDEVNFADYLNDDGALIFKRLRVVTDDVRLDSGTLGGAINRVFFPVLDTIGGDLYVEDDADLKDLDAPLLKTASGVTVSGMGKLSVLKLPSLRTTVDNAESDQYIRIDDNDSLKLVSLPSLKTTEGFDVFENPELELVTAPRLELILGEDGDYTLYFQDNQKLRTIFLPSLEKVVSGDARIQGNDELRHVDLSSLESVTEEVTIRDNAEIRFLNLPKLQSAESLYFQDNPEALVFAVPSLDRVEDRIRIGNNDDELDGNDSLRHFIAPSLAEAGRINIGYNDLQELILPSLEATEEGLYIENEPDLKLIALNGLINSGVDGDDGIGIDETPSLRLVTANRLASIPAIDLGGDGLGNLQLASFPSLRSAGEELQLGNGDVTGDSFQGLALLPQLRAVEGVDDFEVGLGVDLFAPLLANPVVVADAN